MKLPDLFRPGASEVADGAAIPVYVEKYLEPGRCYVFTDAVLVRDLQDEITSIVENLGPFPFPLRMTILAGPR